MGTPLRSPEKAVIPDGLIPKPVIHGLAAIAREDHADRKEKLRFGQQATRLRQLRILREVYRLHLQNWSNKLIAERFGMSPSWVGKKL